MRNLKLTIIFVLLTAFSAFAQDSLESLSKAIEANPTVAENYMNRYDFYKDAWERDETDIKSLTRAVADLSKYISLKPNDTEAFRIRAAMREILFLGANPFSIADYKKALELDASNAKAKRNLAKMQTDYRKMYLSKECKGSRSKNGFQGHPDDEPVTVLGMELDSSIEDGEFDPKPALKSIACGANVNYIYKQGDRRPEFAELSILTPETLIAMLEGGARTENKDKFGNTVLMMNLQTYGASAEDFAKDAETKNLVEKIKILLQYGANVNAKNLKKQSVMALAKKMGYKPIIELLQKAGAK